MIQTAALIQSSAPGQIGCGCVALSIANLERVLLVVRRLLAQFRAGAQARGAAAARDVRRAVLLPAPALARGALTAAHRDCS